MSKMSLNLKSYIQGVKDGTIDVHQTLDSYLAKAKELNSKNNAFVRFHDDYAKNNIQNFKDLPLKGAPIGIKDIILTKGEISSCGSKMLENYVAPYSATCFQNLEKNGGLMIGKTNMDEFAMGGSNITSYFGPVKNPYGTNRVPGGSSGGAAASVAADMCIASLGTDTGGSIRQPASFCGVVGMKPTYGRVSRFGVQAMASSLDQVGPITKTVEDNIILLDAIAGHDSNDATSVKRNDSKSWYDALLTKDLKGLKIAVPKQYFEQGLDKNVKSTILESIETIKSLGAQVDEIDFPLLQYALAVYYIVMPAEASTNLSRMDGIRFGHQLDSFDFDTIYDYYAKVRAEGFGAEVKRRIMVGTYVLSAGYYDAYYKKAQKIRNKLKMQFEGFFKDYDLIVGPTSPTVAWGLDDKADDPLANYLADIYTITANLVGIPAMSLPVGYAEDKGEKMPVGLHILGKHWGEDKIYSLASVLEKQIGFIPNMK
ncbi:MAG: Asp-tRNA(Asn)/Glu-tRNA(Gln) amidotransferase subunit GatA [Candidatus Absconditabacteria bacterium]